MTIWGAGTHQNGKITFYEYCSESLQLQKQMEREFYIIVLYGVFSQNQFRLSICPAPATDNSAILCILSDKYQIFFLFSDLE